MIRVDGGCPLPLPPPSPANDFDANSPRCCNYEISMKAPSQVLAGVDVDSRSASDGRRRCRLNYILLIVSAVSAAPQVYSACLVCGFTAAQQRYAAASKRGGFEQTPFICTAVRSRLLHSPRRVRREMIFNGGGHKLQLFPRIICRLRVSFVLSDRRDRLKPRPAFDGFNNGCRRC